MAECPFCGTTVTEDLITYGGTCPKCFGEIPGEEAPTDPGEEVRARQVATDRRRSTFKAAISLTMMLMLVGCTGALALIFVLWPKGTVAVIEFDEVDMGATEMQFVAAEPDPENPEPEDPKPEVAGTKPSPKPEKPVPDDGVAQVDDPPEIRQADGEVKGVRKSGQNGGTDEEKPSRDPEVRVQAQPRIGMVNADIVAGRNRDPLSDPESVRKAIGERMSKLVPGLNQCYERRLKVMPNLQGRWRIDYTVTTDGKVKGAGVEALNSADPEFEQCLVAKVSGWSGFWPLKSEQPVKRTLNFRPR